MQMPVMWKYKFSTPFCLKHTILWCTLSCTRGTSSRSGLNFNGCILDFKTGALIRWAFWKQLFFMEKGCDWLWPEVDLCRLFANMDTIISCIAVCTSLCSWLFFPLWEVEPIYPHFESKKDFSRITKDFCGKSAIFKSRLSRGLTVSALAFLECCHLVQSKG